MIGLVVTVLVIVTLTLFVGVLLEAAFDEDDVP